MQPCHEDLPTLMMLFQGSHKRKHTEITKVNEIPLKYILKTKRRCTRRMKGTREQEKEQEEEEDQIPPWN
jgi:hypothetical protein